MQTVKKEFDLKQPLSKLDAVAEPLAVLTTAVDEGSEACACISDGTSQHAGLPPACQADSLQLS